MDELPRIVEKILMHHHKHSQWCLEVYPMILRREEMEELNIYADKFFGPFKRPMSDVEYFNGVQLVVLEK